MYIYLSLLVCVIGAFLHVQSGSWRHLGLAMFACGLLVFLFRFDATALHFGR